jgi:hypothetical protein
MSKGRRARMVRGGPFGLRAGVRCAVARAWRRGARCYNARHEDHTDAKELTAVTDTGRFTLICPCCEATLIIDADTGALISHEEKGKPIASFEEMAKGLEKQKQLREQIFAQELGSQKDRERLLEEKFREAMKRADKDTGAPYKNPLDLD